MRKSTVLFITHGLLLVFLFALFAHAVVAMRNAAPRLDAVRSIVSRLGLTDLCLFTDARYTRHPSMADLNTAFQDYPMSFEHFPSGSLVPPPPRLMVRADGSAVAKGGR
jgi:hypothetical protein